MQLWTDYEGVTIDGAFPLRKLLMPEGRSAFFSTAGTHGEPTVVRVIECHFDEEEILSRWRCVEALRHPNFLTFERFGQTEIDGRPVVYAVFEKVDGNLAEVLDQGTLSVTDVAQLASSLVAALEVLHTHGFVHEHIEPRNIFSIHDVVKLRGDCIREAPEGDEGRALKQGDVHDLATVLLQSLTQRASLRGLSDAALPAPFAQIIRNGLDGTWGLDNIRAALGRQFGSNQPSTPTPPPASPATQSVSSPKPPSPAANPSARPRSPSSLSPGKAAPHPTPPQNSTTIETARRAPQPARSAVRPTRSPVLPTSKASRSAPAGSAPASPRFSCCSSPGSSRTHGTRTTTNQRRPPQFRHPPRNPPRVQAPRSRPLPSPPPPIHPA